MQVDLYPVWAANGERVMMGAGVWDSTSEPAFQQLGPQLSVSETEVTCVGNDFGRSHPIPIDSALEVLRAQPEECRSLLEDYDRNWVTNPGCDEGCSCRLAALPGNPAPLFTSLAVLAALLLRRRARASYLEPGSIRNGLPP
jgi:hypothetical protein